MHNTASKSMIWIGVAILTVGAYMLAGLWVAIVVGAAGAWQLNK